MILHTIGYEKATQAGLVAALKAAGVAVLIDVRELPLSRRPGFSKAPLRAALAEAGIGYRHAKALGTPKEGRVANQKGEMDLFWDIVERALARPEAEFELGEAAALARQGPACLLCLEADPHVCHRLRVGEMMAERYGFTLSHLHPEPPF
ncbi:MAG TPA: DUF488 domain-containing protein [Azospirillaceae bacterium]|nr:DUF488 domain-containing protein [Azospirillaceae bacterium]